MPTMQLKFCFLLLVATAQAIPILENPGKKLNESASNFGTTYGLDVSSLLYPPTFQCLKSNGYTFVIVRAYRSVCAPDGNAIHTIANAHQAGIEYVDVYMFPSPTCSKSAAQQVSDMVTALQGVEYGQIWLDIEGKQYWLDSYSANQKFFEELLLAATAHKNVGIYASEYQWSDIMGSSYTGGSSHQLWYAHYDNDPSFSDFKPFGGWTKPSIKQYAGDASVCGADIDKDSY